MDSLLSYTTMKVKFYNCYPSHAATRLIELLLDGWPDGFWNQGMVYKSHIKTYFK
jgi:hypothetical protein